MEFFARSGNPAGQRTDCAIVGVYSNGDLPAATQAINQATHGLLDQLRKHGDLPTKPARCIWLPDIGDTVFRGLLLVGLGDKSKYDLPQYRKSLAAALRTLHGSGVRNAISYLGHHVEGGEEIYRWTRLGVETAVDANYEYRTTKSGKSTARRPGKIGFAISQGKHRRSADKGIRHGRCIAAGQSLARDLGNLPANVCTPSYLAKTARDMAKKHNKLQAEILGPAQIKKLGMGALLAVTQGAKEPVRVIVLKYRGAAADSKPIVLVGKGVTFDTGGVCLKPPPAMDEMKFDMCGAAGVIGTMRAVVELDLPINLIMVVPSCENMPGSNATRPGDVITSMSGKTIEILNTDAEGRLILCDALTYARRFKPDTILDVATLTGACVVALGGTFSGIMTRDDKLAAELLDAGRRACDRAWRLPLDEEYDRQLRSNFADFANSAGREGGASIAANFLGRFTEGLRWAHIDIAGTAWKTGKAKGATGRPVSMLVEYLLSRC